MNQLLNLLLPVYLTASILLIVAVWLYEEFKNPNKKQTSMRKNTRIYTPEKRAEIAVDIVKRVCNEIVVGLPEEVAEKTLLQIVAEVAPRAGIDLPKKMAKGVAE